MRYRGAFTRPPRRRPVRRFSPSRFPVPDPEPCERCGKLFRFYQTEEPRRCEHCDIVAKGLATPKGTTPEGTEPELIYRYPVVLQRCVECDRFEDHATTADDGRCWFCALPGRVTDYGKWDGDRQVLFTRDGLRIDAPNGCVRVDVHDQTSGPAGSKILDVFWPHQRPRWGTGWAVRTLDGDTRWWLTSWDSSD